MIDKLKLWQKAALLVIVPIAFQLCFVDYLYSVIRAADYEAQRERRARDLATRLNSLLKILIDSERTTAIDGWNQFVRQQQPFRLQFAAEGQLLEQITADTPEERKSVETITSLIKQGLDCLAAAYPLVISSEFEKAREYKEKVQDIIDRLSREVEKLLVVERHIADQAPLIQAEKRSQLQQLLLAGSAANLLITAVLIILFNRSTTSRLAQLMDNAMRLGRSLPLNPPLRGSDEIAQLDEVFTRMAIAIEHSTRTERAVVENARDVICSISATGTLTKCSPSSREVLGYSPDQLVGRRLADIVEQEDLTSVMEDLKMIRQGQQKEPFESRIRRQDGTMVHVLWSANWSEAEDAFFCIMHDITERKTAEEVIKQTEASLRLIMDTLPAGLIIVDNDGQIEMVNKTAETIFCSQSKGLLGLDAGSLFDGQGDRGAVVTQLHSILGSEQRCWQTEALTKSNTRIPVEVSVREIPMLAGPRLLVMVADITERRELERMKQDFVSMVSHDLRTPLTAVHIYLDNLSSGVYELAEPAKRPLPGLLRSLDRLVALVKALLDLDRFEAGKMTLLLTDVKVRDVLEQTAQAVSVMADRQAVTLVIPETDRIIVADGDMLVQVLVNLTGNAVKFAPPQSSVTVTFEESSDWLEFKVIDHGKGIPPTMHKSIFEKFGQVCESDARERGGTGLGLPISKAIVEAHGGTIGVESNVGAGSTFWFKLPRLRPSEHP